MPNLPLLVLLTTLVLPASDEIETLPESRGGQDVVGLALPDLEFDVAPPDTGARATLYRWWTDTCPYCEASLPAFEQLRRDYEARGLRVVAVYHPKPPREVDLEAVTATARRLGFRGSIAVDQDWSELKRAYLTRQRRATSISLLADADGVVRFVHPGPVLHPSDDPAEARQDADFRLLEAAVKALVTETPKRRDAETPKSAREPDGSW